MSDPIPSTEEQQTNPEDRRAATALSSLNNDQSGSQLPSTTDQEALGKAMSRLEIAAGQSSASAGQTVRKAVKAEDVSLLVCAPPVQRWLYSSEG